MAVIVATDGRIDDEGAAAVLYLVGGRGPAYLPDEAGIAATGVVWLVAGALIAGVGGRPPAGRPLAPRG